MRQSSIQVVVRRALMRHSSIQVVAHNVLAILPLQIMPTSCVWLQASAWSSAFKLAEVYGLDTDDVHRYPLTHAKTNFNDGTFQIDYTH